MKKNITVFLVFLIFALAIKAGAETTATATTASGAEVNITDNSVKESTVNEKPDLLTPTKQDPALVNAPPVFIKGAEQNYSYVSEFYKKLGWATLTDKQFNKIKVKRIKSERKWSLGQNESDTGEPVIDKVENDEDYLINLGYWPKNAQETNSARVALEDEDNILTQPLSEAWYHAWNKKKAKCFVVLYNTKYISESEATGIGLSLVTGLPLNSNTDWVGSAASGTGYGFAQSSAYKESIFWIIAFDKCDAEPEPSYIPTIVEKAVEQTPPPVNTTQKIEIKVIVSDDQETAGGESKTDIPKEDAEKKRFPKNVEPIADIEFDNDKDEIKPEEMEKIKEAAKRANNDWQYIINNSMEIRIIGGASEPADEDYNLNLGERRAKACVLALIGLLINDYDIPSEQARAIVKYATVGESEKEYKELSKNRRAYILLAKRY